MLPHGIIAVSIVTAYYTRMAEHAHRGATAVVPSRTSRAAARSIMLLIVFSARPRSSSSAFPLARVFTSDLPGARASCSSPTWSASCRSRSCSWRSARSTRSETPARRSSSRWRRSSSIIVGVLLCFTVAPVDPCRRGRTGRLDRRHRAGGPRVRPAAPPDRGSGRRPHPARSLWRFVVAGLAAMIAGAGFLVTPRRGRPGRLPRVLGLRRLVVDRHRRGRHAGRLRGLPRLLRSPDLESRSRADPEPRRRALLAHPGDTE